MTDPAASTIPAGWYADTVTPGMMRWWDGTAWTEHTAPTVPATAPQGMVVERPLLPADRPVYSLFIWVMVLMPLISIVLLLTYRPQIRFTTSPFTGQPTLDQTSMYTPQYFLMALSGFVIYGLSVFFAYRDSVWLKRQGVVRPFPWPWAFLYAAVYVIGRSVIVRRVARPRGFAPATAMIIVIAVSIVASLVWTVMLTSQMVDQMRPLLHQ